MPELPPAVSERPYTPESLAERWGISERQVRRMLASGKLQGFKPGEKLWRISATEVARVEAESPSSALNSEGPAPAGPTAEDIAYAIRATRMIDKVRT